MVNETNLNKAIDVKDSRMKDVSHEVITTENRPTKIDKTSTLPTFPSDNQVVEKENDGNKVVDVEDDGMENVNDEVITTKNQPTIINKTSTFQSDSSDNNMKKK